MDENGNPFVMDKYALIPEFLKVRGLVKNQIESFDHFVNYGIGKVIENAQITSDFGISIRFKSIKVGKMKSFTKMDFSKMPVTPHICRLADLTYDAPIKVDIEWHEIGRPKTTVRKIEIGRLPIMLRSCKCLLNGMDMDELAKVGECPLDPGGYFIVKGTEKVFLIQEQVSKNRIMIHTDKKHGVRASLISSTHGLECEMSIVMEKEKFYIQLHQFVEPIPVMVIFRALGIESDQEVAMMIGDESDYTDLFLPSIQECASEGIYTREQALEYLKPKVRSGYYEGTAAEKAEQIMDILRNVFLANVPVHENELFPKCIHVAVMVRRLMEAILDEDTIDDKDYVGNKRLELSGQLIALLFEDVFKTMCTQIRNRLNFDHKRGRSLSSPEISAYLSQHDLFRRLEVSILTGNWDVKRTKMHRKGVTQVVSRLSYIAAISHMMKISSSVQMTQKVGGPRAVYPSQWGMICPLDTPLGEACGLVRNLALITHVTTDGEEEPLISLCHSLGIMRLAFLRGEALIEPSSFLVMVNGRILGKHRRPQRFASDIRKLRRAGTIGEFVSVFVNERERCVYVSSDGGRLCRPLVIADKGLSRIKEHHVKELKDGACVFDDFVYDCLIEYLDVDEMNDTEIALYEGEAGQNTTHIEIEPFTILGVCAGLIPFLHHNQNVRNIYQCAMGRQAIGNIAYNQLSRMDSLLYLSVYPQRPLLTTKSIELIDYDKLGAGQNAIVAVMSYSGYDTSNSIIMNKSSLDRGFGRCIVTKKYVSAKKTYMNQTSDRIIGPTGDHKEQKLDTDGIASPGEIIEADDIYIKKQTPVNTRENARNPKDLPDSAYRNTFLRYKRAKDETGVVDRVALYSDMNNNLCIKLLIRHTRRPEVGDKFSSRHGQRGVCGLIVQQEDFPFSEFGICPDLIINPHVFPSDMTIGKMMELLGSKAGASCGKFHYGSAFGQPNGHADRVEVISETLVKHKFNYSGKDLLYSGITGCPLQAYIFMGPIYYQQLKHMVVDKMHAQGQERRSMLTRQPHGGVRMGENDRDCLIAYGASNLINERMMLSSDAFQVQVCGKCGLMGYYDHKLRRGYCSMCKNGDNISTLNLPYACKLLFQELQSMNVVPRLKLTEA